MTILTFDSYNFDLMIEFPPAKLNLGLQIIAKELMATMICKQFFINFHLMMFWKSLKMSH